MARSGMGTEALFHAYLAPSLNAGELPLSLSGRFSPEKVSPLSAEKKIWLNSQKVVMA
jgi:hypothetical protein